MTTLASLRAAPTGLDAAGWAAGPAGAAALAHPAGAAGAGHARWLEGLDDLAAGGGAPLGGASIGADPPPAARGLDAAGHAQRVLAALVGGAG